MNEKILTTSELIVEKTIYTADWIETYEDGIPLSSSRLEYDSAEERLADLKKDYADDEINIDTDENSREIGWEFGQYTTMMKVIIEVVEVNGKITVRQKK